MLNYLNMSAFPQLAKHLAGKRIHFHLLAAHIKSSNQQNYSRIWKLNFLPCSGEITKLVFFACWVHVRAPRAAFSVTDWENKAYANKAVHKRILAGVCTTINYAQVMGLYITSMLLSHGDHRLTHNAFFVFLSLPYFCRHHSNAAPVWHSYTKEFYS